MISTPQPVANGPHGDRGAHRPERLIVDHSPVERRAVPAAAAFRMLSIGPTLGWRLIREGRLEAIKIGRSTVVTVDAIDRFIDEAPRRKPAAANTQEQGA